MGVHCSHSATSARLCCLRHSHPISPLKWPDQLVAIRQSRMTTVFYFPFGVTGSSGSVSGSGQPEPRRCGSPGQHMLLQFDSGRLTFSSSNIIRSNARMQQCKGTRCLLICDIKLWSRLPRDLFTVPNPRLSPTPLFCRRHRQCHQQKLHSFPASETLQ